MGVWMGARGLGVSGWVMWALMRTERDGEGLITHFRGAWEPGEARWSSSERRPRCGIDVGGTSLRDDLRNFVSGSFCCLLHHHIASSRASAKAPITLPPSPSPHHTSQCSKEPSSAPRDRLPSALSPLRPSDSKSQAHESPHLPSGGTRMRPPQRRARLPRRRRMRPRTSRRN